MLGSPEWEITQTTESGASRDTKTTKTERPTSSINSGLELIGVGEGGTLQKKKSNSHKSFFQKAYLFLESYELANPEEQKRILQSKSRFAMHPHIFKNPTTLEEAKNALANYEQELSFLFVPDTAHLAIAKENIESLFETIDIASIPAIHLTNWTPEFGLTSYNYAKGFTELNDEDGIVQVRSFIQYLMKHKYERKWLGPRARSHKAWKFVNAS